MTTTQPGLCACGCGRPQGPAHRGWSRACYFRWYRAGAHEGEPPPPPRNGPEYSASLREEVTWLVEGGTSVAEAARRVGVGVQVARRYVAPPPPECAHDGCTTPATHRRWCDDHKYPHRLYRELRASGVGRQDAARQVGVRVNSTYVWEPGQSGTGRPRKRAAA